MKKKPRRINPVAKHSEKFNRPSTHRDRKKDDKRGKQKYRRRYDETCD